MPHRLIAQFLLAAEMSQLAAERADTLAEMREEHIRRACYIVAAESVRDELGINSAEYAEIALRMQERAEKVLTALDRKEAANA